jgi:tetratricopeptide (TPR) repeat protein
MLSGACRPCGPRVAPLLAHQRLYATVQEAGNTLLQQGRKIGKRHVIKQASDKYSEGLSILHAAGATYAVPAQLRTALYSNRAFAESLIGNWRNALDSARWAIRTDRSHLKSYFRAAQAAQQLKRWSDALEVCKRGLEVEPGAAELLKIQQVQICCCCGLTTVCLLVLQTWQVCHYVQPVRAPAQHR